MNERPQLPPEYSGIPTSTSISPAPKSNRVRNGVLWILSPFIVLVAAAVLALLSRLLGINTPVVNIITTLLGVTGVMLVFVGPLVGIIKLADRK